MEPSTTTRIEAPEGALGLKGSIGVLGGASVGIKIEERHGAIWLYKILEELPQIRGARETEVLRLIVKEK